MKRSSVKGLPLTIILPVLLLIVGLGLRISYALLGPAVSESLWSDMVIYFRISEQVSQGIWKAYHFFQSIGYPLLINQLSHMTSDVFPWIVFVQCIASCATLLIFYSLASESLGKKIGLISLGIGAVHLPWILFSNYALPESLFTFCLSAAGWYGWKIANSEKPAIRHGILWAVFFMAGFWLKGTHALWGPIFLASVLVIKRKASLASMFFLCAIVSSSLAIHGALTYSKIGKIQLSASAGGLNFIEGKCPDKVNMDTEGYRWHSPLYYQLELKSAKSWDRPFTDSGYFFKQGLQCIKRDPFVLVQSLESIAFLFIGNTTWPFNRKPEARYMRFYELMLAVFFIVGLATYALMATRGRVSKSEFITWCTPILALFLCVYIFKSEMRYRAPFDIWLIPVAVKGWFGFLKQEHEV